MAVIAIRKNNTYTASELYQWDYNRILEIYGVGLKSLPEIHFANAGMSRAIVKQAEPGDNGSYKVMIPNVLLENAKDITVYVCGYDGEEFISYYSLVIKVKPRVRPADYIADTEEPIYSFNALENLVNTTVVNLELNNENLHENIIAEVKALNEQTKKDITEIVNNAIITDADTVDGFHALDFELSGRPGKTVFNADGSITTTYDDGSVDTVVFNEDGSITTTSNTLGLGVRTETTKFNADGSITVEVTVREAE